MQRRIRRRGAVMAAVAVLAAAACAETETTTTDTGSTPAATDVAGTTDAATDDTTPADTSPADTSPADTSPAEVSAAEQWSLDYVGGMAGAASGDPVRIGFASSSDFFPDANTSVDATVAYVNDRLGGIDGRPIELVPCTLSVPEDGAACATEFANDDSIVLAMVGQALVGSGDFYATISGKKPVYTAAPSGVEDFTTTISASYFSGALGASLGIAGYVIEEVKPQVLGVLITDDAAGRGGYSVLEPILNSEGAELRPVFVPPTATAPEVEAALQAIQVDQVDALVLGVFEQGCIAAYDALTNLGIDAMSTPVIAVSPCHGAAMQAHLADLGAEYTIPNGWYFSGAGYSVFTGDAESGTDSMLEILETNGTPELAYSVGVIETVSGLMTLVKHLNALDGDYSMTAIDAAIRSYPGPVMATAGEMQCGAPPIFKGVCATRASIERYLDGDWEATRSGDNSIDIRPFVSPGA